MKLKGSDFKEIQQALTTAFPDTSSLGQLVRFGLDEDLATIGGGRSVSEGVYNLITWAESRGQMEVLLRAACAERPRNAELRAVATRLFGPITAASPAESSRTPVPEQLQNKLRILFLAASPSDSARVAVNWEVRHIGDAMRTTGLRDRVELHTSLDSRMRDIAMALVDVKPQIVHFTGHGTDFGEIVAIDDQERVAVLEKASLAAIFGALNQKPKLVVFSWCGSASQAAAIVEHVDCAIGMGKTISQDGAIVFVSEFYRALSFGESVLNAFNFGIACLTFRAHRDESRVPRISTRSGIDLTNWRLL